MTTISILIGLAVFVAICWLAWRAGTLEKTPYIEDTDETVDARISTIRGALESSDDTGAYLREIQRRERVRAGAKP